MERKILIWCGNSLQQVTKKEIFKELLKRHTLITCNTELQDCIGIILGNLYETTCIQLYQDGVVRLHLENKYYEKPCSVFVYNLSETAINYLSFLLTHLF